MASWSAIRKRTFGSVGELSPGDIKNAKMLAERAKSGLPQGTPAWVKADDIMNFKMEKVRG